MEGYERQSSHQLFRGRPGSQASTLTLVRVLIDDQIFNAQTYGGISRYFAELMQAFRSDSSLDVDLATPELWTKNVYLKEAGLGRSLPALLGNRREVLRLANWMRLRVNDHDVLHHTYYNRGYLQRFSSSEQRVVTVYDMIPELMPEEFPNGNPHQDKRRFVEEADLVLCISESTRRDLLAVYGEIAAPVIVTPLGVDGRFEPGMRRPRALPERYVLFVGSRTGYKDFDVLAEAFAESKLVEHIWLVLVGGPPLQGNEAALLARLGISDRVMRVSMTDRELVGAYANAACFVFPSRYEGFGLPTLEAMASGCPVVLAASSAHLEVGGDSALFFPPGDVSALSHALNQAMFDEELRRDLVESGVQRAAQFSWRQTARLTADAYQQLGISP